MTHAPAHTRASLPNIAGVHAHLIERMAANAPSIINPFHNADSDDLQDRADHLRGLLSAVRDYVGACLHDTADSTWGMHLDRKWIDACFDDLIGDAVGAIENAVDTLRQAA
jgi:hypothetical protein